MQPRLITEDGGVFAGGGEPVEHLRGILAVLADRVDRAVQGRPGGVQALQLQLGVGVEQQVAGGGGHPGGQR